MLVPPKRRPARLYEIEFALHHAASPPGSRATLEVLDHPAHASGVAPLDDRISRAIEAASGWVIERYMFRR
jgi:hypothetical protein